MNSPTSTICATELATETTPRSSSQPTTNQTEPNQTAELHRNSLNRQLSFAGLSLNDLHHHNNNNSFDSDHSSPAKRGSTGSRGKKSRIVIRKFQKLDQSVLHSTPAPDVKIGQRVAYKEYYGNEFGTIRWIGRVPQICPDWTVGVEFDNAIGEGDGSLNGRRYFIAKDCFAKFLSLNDVALVDQHVGRPEPGTMISVMSAAVRPGQMISIQRVSTVHVQHCFLNAPHQIPGADILAVNTRLHCQCPNCGPCAHVIKPPRTQRIARAGKNATHMCQFSTYTCCGMESQEETMCTYRGNKAASLPPPAGSSAANPPLPPIGNSWFEGAGYLSQLQAQQSKLMPHEYKLGAAPEDIPPSRRHNKPRASGKRNRGRNQHQQEPSQVDRATSSTTDECPTEFAGEKVADINSRYEFTECPPSYTPPNYTARPDKSQWVEPVWCEPSEPTVATSAKALPKSAKVVYRDSIENRYLFPTDDPIDSKLEADLENLSQARYGHCTNSRLNGPRNIFKSLRSLVSCMSAQSNHSELDRHSEETMRFSEHKDKAGNSNNKAVPAIASTNGPQRFCEAQNGNHGHDYDISKSTNDIPVKNTISNHNTSISSEYYTKEGKEEYSSSNRKLVQPHISSSSDCGFSSASQNSIPNYTKPMISGEEDMKRYKIYQNFLDQLVTSTAIKNDELISLERILFGRNHDGCCLHSNSPSFEGTSTCEQQQQQILLNRLKKSCLQPNGDAEQVRATSACCYSTNYCPSSSEFDMNEKLGDRISCDGEVTKKLKSSRDHYNHQPPKSLCGNSSISGSATLSSDDSFRAATATASGGINQSSNLPKAFELKLTLSINSNSDQQTESEHNDAIATQNTDRANESSININVVSSNNGEITISDGDGLPFNSAIKDNKTTDVATKQD